MKMFEHTVIRRRGLQIHFCLWIMCAMSVLSGALLLKGVTEKLSFVSPSGCQLVNTTLGINASCSRLNLTKVPPDLPINIHVLDLSFNKIAALDNKSFKHLQNITTLDLASNVLLDVESGTFEPLYNLTELSLERNRLASLPPGLFRTNLFLSILVLNRNKLTSIPSRALPWSNRITKLDLNANRISKINPYDFIPLQNCSLTLNIGNNALKILKSHSFSYLNHVKTLTLSNNAMRKFHISSLLGNIKIESLLLQSCNIYDIIPLKNANIPLNDFPNITCVNLARNKLINISSFMFVGLNQTNVLNLQANLITKMSDRDTFCGLDKLTVLDLSINQLSYIKLEMFSCNRRLRILNFATNHIRYIYKSRVILPYMERLDLSSNNFYFLKKQFLSGFPNLKILKLSYNELKKIYSPELFINLKHLKELRMSHTNYQFLNGSFCDMKALSILDLSFTGLMIESLVQFTNTSSLETLILRDSSLWSGLLYENKTGRSLFTGLKSLVTLDLRENDLGELEAGTFKPLEKLTVLRLSKSSIKVLNSGVFDGLTSLKKLFLDGNEISIVPEDLFKRQQHLLILYINNNQLRMIPKTLFDGTPSLSSLYMQQNKITKIEPKTKFPTKNFLKLDVSENPFSCRCDLSWFVEWLRNYDKVELVHPYDTICSPSSFDDEVDFDILSFFPDLYCDIDIVMVTSVSLSALVVMVISVVAYRKRWWLNYKLFLINLAIFGYEEFHQEFDPDGYEYQLNLMYIEDDQEWVDQIMKPVLQERFPHLERVVFGDNDLNLGMFYLNALHHAVDNSFKTVLLISYNSVDDAWFLTKLRIALEHINDTRLDKVILIFLEDIQDDDLPYLARLFLSKNKPYMLWTDDADGQELFWAQFEKSMRGNRALNSVIPV